MQQLSALDELERRLKSQPQTVGDPFAELERRLGAPKPATPVTPTSRVPGITEPVKAPLRLPPPMSPIASHGTTPVTPKPSLREIADMKPVASHQPAPAPTPVTPLPFEATPIAMQFPQIAAAGQIPIVREFLEGTQVAAAGMGESLAGLGNWLGVVPDEWRAQMSDAAKMVTPELAAKSIADDPLGTIGNPRWWATQGGQAAGSMVALGSVGNITRALTALRYAPAAAAAIAEALTEGGSVYSQARQQGMSPDDAGAAATKVTAANLALLGATNAPIFDGVGKTVARRILTATGSEAGQEMAQQGASNLALGRDLTEGMLESGVIGGMAGGGTRAGFEVAGQRTQGRGPGATPVTPATAPMQPMASHSSTPVTPSKAAYGTTVGSKVDDAHARALAAIAALESRQQAAGGAETVTGPSASTDGTVVASGQPGATSEAPAGSATALDELERRAGQPEPGSDEARRQAMDAAVNAPMPKTFAEMPNLEKRELRRMLAELREFEFDPGGMPRGRGVDADQLAYTPGHANAAIFRPLKGNKSRTGDQVRASLEKFIAGTGRLTTIGQDFVRIARIRGYVNSRFGEATDENPTARGTTLDPEWFSEPGEIYVKPKRWGQADQAKEREIIAAVEREPQKYIDDNRAKHGTVINPDHYAETLSKGDKPWEHHQASRGTANELAAIDYRDRLNTPVTETDETVLMTAGGPGVGKSTGLGTTKPGQIVFDSTMSNHENARARVKAALDSGRSVKIQYVHGDPIATYLDRVLPRGAKEGRTLTPEQYAERMVGAPETVLAIYDEFAPEKRPFDEPAVVLKVVENQSGAYVKRDPEWLRAAQRYTDADVLAKDVRAAVEQRVAEDPTQEAIARASGAIAEGRRGNGRSVRQESERGVDASAAAGTSTADGAVEGRGPRASEEGNRRLGEGDTKAEPTVEQPNAVRDPQSSAAPRRDVDPPKGGKTPVTRSEPRSAVALPSRALYAPKRALSTPVTPASRNRPVSEQQTVDRLNDVWRVTTHSGNSTQPTRSGRLWSLGRVRSAMGAYFTDSGLIRLKDAGDMTTYAHELGHAISDRWFGIYGRPHGLFANELLRLGRHTSRPSYSRAQVMEEGVAEYWRTRFADPAAAQRAAPAFTAEVDRILAGNDEFAKRVAQSEDLIQRYLNQTEYEQALARTSSTPVGAKDRFAAVRGEMAATSAFRQPWLARFRDALKHTGNLPITVIEPKAAWDRFLANWFDNNTAAGRVMQDLEAAGVKVDPAHDPRFLSRLAQRSDGIAESFLSDHVRRLDGTIIGPGVLNALKPVKDFITKRADNRPNVDSLLHALRADELHSDGKGRDPGMTTGQVKQILAAVAADPIGAKLTTAAQEIQRNQRAMREWMFENGGLTAEQKTQLETSEAYVPLNRVMDTIRDAANGRAPRSPIKALKGSTRDVLSPTRNIVSAMPRMVEWTLDNRAIGAMADLVAKTPHMAHWLVEVPEQRVTKAFNLEQLEKTIHDTLQQQGIQLPANVNLDVLAKVFLPATFELEGLQVATFVDGGPNGTGKRRYFQVQNPSLWQWLKDFGPQHAQESLSWGKWLLEVPAQVIRRGATSVPSFQVGANLFRDAFSSLFQSRFGTLPFEGLPRLAFAKLTKDPDVAAMLGPAGATFGTLGGRQTPRSQEKWIQDRVRPGVTRQIVRAPGKLMEALGEFIEQSTRFAEYKNALAAGGVERGVGLKGIARRVVGSTPVTPLTGESLRLKAAQASQDVTLPFREGGRHARTVNRYVPFFNATMLGARASVQSIKADPAGWALTTGALVALQAFLWSREREKERYQEEQTYRKRTGLWIDLGESGIFTPPLPEGIPGFVAGLTPIVLDEIYERSDHNAKQKMLRIGKEAGTVGLRVLPPLGSIYLSVASNYDLYRDRPIVSPFDQKKAPDLQVKPYTAALPRAIGHAVGASPLKVDAVGYGLLSNTWSSISALAEGPSRAALERIAGKPLPQRPSPPWSKTPLAIATGVSRLVQPKELSLNSQSLNEFYDVLDELETGVNSIRAYDRGAGLRNPADAKREFTQRFSEEQFNRIRQADKVIDALRDDLHAVEGATNLSRDEKKRYADDITARMVRTARWALGRGDTPVSR